MSDGLHDRLRRQRRDGGAAARGERAGRGGLPGWLAQRLTARAGTPAAALAPGAAHATPRSLDPPADLVRVHGPEGAFLVRERRYALAERHGAWPLGAIDLVRADELALLARDPALETFDARAACYLDVETTGLSGGAGTISFLVALGAFEADEFVLWQGFLAGPEEERAMLAEVARRVAAASGLVSFFGKSFDRHRLEDKMRLHGVAPPFDDRPHLDLYHPLRRLYGRALPDGKLQTLERALCGVVRDDDLPGSFAPEAWFDFLGGRAHRLEDVFRHNADDVLSLAVLAAHLGHTLREEPAPGTAPATTFDAPLEPTGSAERALAASRARGLAQLFAERREEELALEWVARARARGLAEDRELEFLRADLVKRTGAVEQALELFEALAAVRDELALRALIEVAKLCEHGLADCTRAHAAARRAAELVKVATVGAARARLERELARRLARLEAKR